MIDGSDNPVIRRRARVPDGTAAAQTSKGVTRLPLGRGRPHDPAKRSALIDAARGLFLEFGIGAVKVDQVIAAAGVSRATYYRNFAGRDELIAAVFARESKRIASDKIMAGKRDTGLREQLIAYGDAIMRFLADPDTMRFEWSIQQVREAQPALAGALFRAGPKRAWRHLRRIIAAARARDEIGDVDPEQAVNDLIGLWVGAWRTEMAYGHRAAPDEAEQRQRSQHAVDLFLRAHAPQSRSVSAPEIRDESVW